MWSRFAFGITSTISAAIGYLQKILNLDRVRCDEEGVMVWILLDGDAVVVVGRLDIAED